MIIARGLVRSGFEEFSVVSVIYLGYFLMYLAFGCGEDLSSFDPLHRVNMIWQLLHKSYRLFLLQSNMLWCCCDSDLLWYYFVLDLLWWCDMFYYDVVVVHSNSAILMLMQSVLSLSQFCCIMSWDVLWMMMLYYRYCDKCMMQYAMMST